MRECRWFGAAAVMALLVLPPALGQAGEEGLPETLPGLMAPAGGVSLDGLGFQASSMYTSPASGLSLASAANSGAIAGIGKSYVQARMGPLWFLGDADDLDVGLNFEVAYGYRLLEVLALEFQSGYFWGEDGPVELWGLPVMVNAKVHIPVPILDLYAGGGIGGYYVDIDVGIFDENDFVFGGQIFVGAGIEVGPLAVGGELKYFITDESDDFGGMNLEGVALMAMASISF